ncbi:MAG: hypothetical protein K8L99_31455 [Anaerolineae bacterium]|nr:hypothetical protein [Anaerolineae bacterium]
MKARLLLLTAMFSLLLVLSVIALAQGDVTTNITDRVKLRYGPGLEWTILGYYEAGTPMRLDGQAYEGEWVRGILPDGQYGWVISSALAISQGEAAGLPTVWVDTPFTLPPPGGAAPAAEAAPEEAAPEDGAPAEPVTIPAASGVSANDLSNLAFAPVPGPYTMPLPGLDATDPVYNFPFKQWGDDDGRTNYHVGLDGMAVYCVNSGFVPEETYRNGGILVKDSNYEPILYVPVGTIAVGYQSMLASGQNTLLGTSKRTWHGDQPVALYLLAGGNFQVNFINSSGGMSDFEFSRCRPIPRETNDGCPPGWDVPPWGGDCVHADFDGVPPSKRWW